MGQIELVYKERYNAGRGLPEPTWGAKVPLTGPGRTTPLICPACNSSEVYFSASADDPEEIFLEKIRCKNCGIISDFFDALKRGKQVLAGEQFTEYTIIHKKEDTMQAYCVKCRQKQDMKDAKAILMKNGRPATTGLCAVCGTKMYKIGKS